MVNFHGPYSGTADWPTAASAAPEAWVIGALGKASLCAVAEKLIVNNTGNRRKGRTRTAFTGPHCAGRVVETIPMQRNDVKLRRKEVGSSSD
jgi:hypothetical protein